MGYLSDVCLAVAVKTKEQADELMAVYALDPQVQKHSLASAWTRHDYPDSTVFSYQDTNLKWYESFGSVQGLEYLLSLARTFHEERTDVGWIPEGADKPEIVVCYPYAAYKLRLGEDYKDIEEESHSSDANLESDLYDRMYVRREIVTDF